MDSNHVNVVQVVSRTTTVSFHRALGACPSPTAECIIVVLVLSALWLSSIHFHAYVARNHPATSRLHTAASLLLRFCCLITASYIVPATDEIRKRAGVIVCVRMSGSFLHPFGNKKRKNQNLCIFFCYFTYFISSFFAILNVCVYRRSDVASLLSGFLCSISWTACAVFRLMSDCLTFWILSQQRTQQLK